MPSPVVSPDAIVRTEDEPSSVWNSLQTFYRAPCLKSSLALGAGGGLALGTLRRFSGSAPKAAFTWGCVVGGLLAGTSWYTCRRSLYNAAMEEIELMQRVSARDPGALEEYRQRLELRGTKGPRQ